MSHNKNYHLGVLYLMRLLINADGIVDISENDALNKVKRYESIPEPTLIEFEKDILNKREKEVYQTGIDFINLCSDEEKMNAFVHLYKMSEADGRVHVKEVRLLLYSIRQAKIEFNDVVAKAKQLKYG
ncbi:MAG TPA: hypothetical protein PKN99_03540 [Cyclobacteriaceae bacterium]|nr:hypothetical protein [Cyclobacteriaceae bacterium]HNP06670.1 hypothetical protein [Cyclobacteriaceae bacterium]HRK55610.1 hypothetical protein [Cyclobacteriaceae bacterium]